MHKSKALSVIITGVDGSGKTTLAMLLTEYLRWRGYRVKLVWIKSSHTIAYVISTFFQLVRKGHRFNNPNKIPITRIQPSDYKSFSKLWPIVEFVSVLPWIVFKVYFPIMLGYSFVGDRYVIDTVVMISMSVKDEAFVDSFLARVLLRMIPKGTIVFYLDIDSDTVLQRRPDIEYTLEELKTQLILYKKLASEVGAYTLDTARLGISETMGEILEELPL